MSCSSSCFLNVFHSYTDAVSRAAKHPVPPVYEMVLWRIANSWVLTLRSTETMAMVWCSLEMKHCTNVINKRILILFWFRKEQQNLHNVDVSFPRIPRNATAVMIKFWNGFQWKRPNMFGFIFVYQLQHQKKNFIRSNVHQNFTDILTLQSKIWFFCGIVNGHWPLSQKQWEYLFTTNALLVRRWEDQNARERFHFLDFFWI